MATREAMSRDNTARVVSIPRVSVVPEADSSLGNHYAAQAGQPGLCVQRSADGSCSGCCGACQSEERTEGSQAGLKVGAPDGPHEVKADHVADQIVQRHEDEATELVGSGSGGNPVTDQIGQPIAGDGIGHKSVCGPAANADGIASTLDHTRGEGKPLHGKVRLQMENAFGVDFDNVRLHTDTRAAAMSRQLGAHAFTQGNDIYFGEGEFDATSQGGRRLLAHELTHTLQQRAGRGRQHRMDPAEAGESFDVQRACGRTEIGSPTGCTGSSEEPPEHEGARYRFTVNCDSFRPGERERLAAAGAAASKAGTALEVHGYASSEGDPAYNVDLSCARAVQAVSVLEGAGAVVAHVYSHGPVHGDPGLRRSVVVRHSVVHPPVPPPTRECVPKAGIENSDCGRYAKETWWLPEAYVHNATCACKETPNDPTAKCVRKFLQDRLDQVDQAKKAEAAQWLGALMTRRVSKDMYINFVQLELAPMIFKDHVDAYRECCCPSGPAPIEAWRGVTTLALPCSVVGESIRQFGSCHGTPGKW
ncbi:DUF4157 domain-containing protein [Rhodococcus sp. MTM3W5.2]|uniref:eCIS core domain-containing protein n=1 Tax=Rhodococcus sp. MTM3W5.2 TaxID=1805827 RepID=UPI00097BEBAF|nr:DUF4157 domain-containing protein [Rhodococcus sp. MTM3W5.2]